MANPHMPQMPGAAVVTDTLDFVKNLWSSMGVPGMGMPGLGVPGITAPTLSVEELDKKINDLKAVETWLNLNISMLRGSIQALEVQRGTITTLQSMGASMAAAMTQPGASDKSLFETVPYAAAFFQQPAAAKAAAPEPAQQAKPQAEAPPTAAAAPAGDPAAGDAATQAAAQLANPSVWWNLLQDQFKLAVSSAMASDPAGVKPAAPAGKQEAGPAQTATPAKARAPAKRTAPKAKPAGKT
ncbi:PhaM family polyhydroxyalkanoate granule multifunctional regulatory protein [Janthinobacterium aquaticum]|uniref:PhaM family polyhydroxyalkanoate granule multifunctional regulatory protein n=1 Tax=Janthinobacterium sp. FT58W TaxID=2654254 RepID=UPI001264B0EE|nr:PhaM family polyhydroxyalkanoate granule multifunctional regulatory protein [Janthinobacterium sp. FT58W]KAB8042065.1 hypothetical protein GCM43_15605 [Janthinobacterium sp. FT58W]